MSATTQTGPDHGFTADQLDALDQEHAEREAGLWEDYETEAHFL